MRAGAAIAGLALTLAGCSDPHAPDTLASQRLKAGDQRLIGYMPVYMHAPPYAVVGVECGTLGFPIQILEPTGDPVVARSELLFAARVNRSIVQDRRYSASSCQPLVNETSLGHAVDEQVVGFANLPPTESFEAIFGFPVAEASLKPIGGEARRR